ncbi:MAG: nucleoside-diphosphate sugar epimerase/dehydratase, partial [Actinomycetota bacterium]
MAEPAGAVEEKRGVLREPLPLRSAKRIALRLLADTIAVSTALFIASILRFEILSATPAAKVDYTVVTIIATPLWLMLFWLYGLYEPRQVLSPINEFKQVFHGVIGGIVAIFLADSIFNLELARLWVVIAMIAGLLIVGGERLIIRKTLHFMRRRGADAARTIVVGANHEARTVARTLDRERWLGYHIIGFVDDSAPLGQDVVNGQEVLGRIADLKDLVHDHRATLVVVASTALDAQR